MTPAGTQEERAIESAALKPAPRLPAPLHAGLIALLILGAAIAWAVTGDRMGGMDAGPGTELGDVGWFVGVWVVMMAAMMFPAISPMVLMYARVQAGKREKGQATPTGATALFVAGYLIAWGSAGLLAYGIFAAVRSLELDFLAWDEGGRYFAAGVILAAAVYQLTPLKDVCLRKCRSPLTFVLHGWRPGRAGALRLGIEHGAWCFGCCWALMAALFALGVMSIGWMALIAAFIATEKMLPWKAVANRGVAVVLLVLAIGVAASPENVPGLTIPNSAEANEAMEAMGMGPIEAEPATEEDPAMGGEPAMEEGPAMGNMKPKPMDDGMKP